MNAETVKTKGVKTSKPTKNYRIGETVSWASHANGHVTAKTGRIVAVLNPEINYRNLRGLSKAFYERILREQGFTRDNARKYIKKPHYTDDWVTKARKVFTLKFNPKEGMCRRNTYHYLVEVESKGKLYLYHPKLK